MDDEPDVREIAADMLTDAGHYVRAAASGAEALALLAAAPADALVVDLAMPGISGPELARQARALHPGLPVLLLTGHVDTLPWLPEASLPVLRKPYSQSALLEAVARTIASSGAAAGGVSR